MYDSTSADDVDPYAPKAWSGGSKTTPEVTDACIGHPDGNGNYHYHIMSPCLLNTNANYTLDVCDQVPDCKNEMFTWVMEGYSNHTKNRYVTGITFDGHPLFGPYDDSGDVVECDELDACNGVLQSNGSYAYYMTNTFPYGPGCFGPAASSIDFVGSCSTNTCNLTSSNSTSDSQMLYISLLSTIISLLYALM